MSETTAATSERLTHERAREVFQRAYDLMNQHDPAHIPAIFTEDLVFEDDAWPETIRGHAEMNTFLSSIWRGFPDFRFQIVEGPFLSEDGRRAALRVRVTGTALGPLDPPGFAPTGRVMSTEYGGFYELEGERVKHARIIINMNDVAIQIGAAPPPGSRGERLAVLMQRLNARRMRGRAGI